MSMRNPNLRAKGQSRQFVVRLMTAVKLKGEIPIGPEPEEPDCRRYPTCLHLSQRCQRVEPEIAGLSENLEINGITHGFTRGSLYLQLRNRVNESEPIHLHLYICASGAAARTNLVYSLNQHENNQELFEQICPFVPQLRDEPNKLE